MEEKLLRPKARLVFIRLCEGKMQKEIAAELGLSIKTVKHHIDNIHHAFDVRSTTQLLALLLRRERQQNGAGSRVA